MINKLDLAGIYGTLNPITAGLHAFEACMGY